MPKFERGAWLFSLNSLAGALLALFIALSLGMTQPYWAMTTAYIVSQPLSGAVRSKAVFRIFGTLLGGAAAVVLVPGLVNTPELLSLALALWVGFCLAVSLLDRTPRSYVMMLAGYTAAIIGFPSVAQPGAVFDVTVARMTEIGLGILCASLTHSLIFPQPVGEALKRRATAWLADADHWALDILRAGEAGALAADRRHLAADAGEIRLLSTHLPFDTSNLRETGAAVRALHARMLLLIPLLSGLADRVGALAPTTDEEARTLLDAAAEWIDAGSHQEAGVRLAARIETLAARRRPVDWPGLLIESLLVRLAEAVRALAEAHALLGHLSDPETPLTPALRRAIGGAGRGALHADLPLALRSGAAASLAILITCAVWILGGWGDGAGAATMTAVFCCFFAAMDDPSPAILRFGVFILLGLPLAALYLFAILPRVDGFPMLAAVLAPPLLVVGAIIHDPKWSAPGLAATMGFCNAMALQSTYAADFAGFLNANLGQAVGLMSALAVTTAVRSMDAEAAVRRLLRRSWASLARLARARRILTREDFAGQLIDRLGLITPRLATASEGRAEAIAARALRDLRVGMNLAALQDLRPALDGAPRTAVETLLGAVGDHYGARAVGRPSPDRPGLLVRIDSALNSVAGGRSVATARGLSALVGLRRGLFPRAPAYEPEVPR